MSKKIEMPNVVECPPVIHYNGHWIRYWKAGSNHPIHGRLDVARLVISESVYNMGFGGKQCAGVWQSLNMYGIKALENMLAKSDAEAPWRDAAVHAFGLDQKPSGTPEKYRKQNARRASMTVNAMLNKKNSVDAGGYLPLLNNHDTKWKQYPENGADV